MLKHTTLTAIVLVATSATAFADDGDVLHARALLEDARTFGVVQVAGRDEATIEESVEGRAAGQADGEGEPEAFRSNAKRWDDILESQSRN